MTRFIFCVGFLLSVSLSFAQKVYFVYFESEAQQPFFARINEKTYNSSASGFLILSNLRDSIYSISIGFPQDKWPEQRFSIPIKSKDRGYQLKNFGEKGWGLFDLQTLSLQMSEGPVKSKSSGIKEGGVSTFTALLSKAANDPSLMEESSVAVVKYDDKPAVVQQAAKKEDATTQKEQPAANGVAADQTKKQDVTTQKEPPAATAVAADQTKKQDVTTQKEPPAANAVAADQTKKQDVTTQKEQPAATVVAADQTKKQDVTTQKEPPAANAVAADQTKKQDVNAQKEPPAATAVAADQTKKQDVTTQKEPPAATAIAADQTKKQDVTTQKEPPAANAVAADQTKKQDVTTQKEPPAATAVAADQTKKQDVNAQKAQPPANAIAADQTKKEQSPVETTKVPQDKTNTVKTGEQQKKPETAVAKNTENAEKNSGTAPIVENPGQTNVPVTPKDKGEIKPSSPEKYKKSMVTKKSESSTTDGFGLVFIDKFSDGQKDTIEIFIPNPKEDVDKKSETASQPKKFLDIGNDEKGGTANTITNKACASVATDKDFFNLRKKMAAQETDEQMINESKKGFKSKCYSTEQIKNLGSLFLKEPGKFQFYEAAYPFSSDQGNFVALQSDFKDNYFVYRFKKLVN